MSQSKNQTLKRMGVMNITPNSFSDGGELSSLEKIERKFLEFKDLEAIDLGAESTAPMNNSISAPEEWERIKPVLPILKHLRTTLSLDTYHPETIHQMMKFRFDNKIQNHLIWNDVSGKFDQTVKDFLSENPEHQYVYCHNQAPGRELSGRHMDFTKETSLEDLRNFFQERVHPQLIFDPCLGFSKTYEDNWMILENFEKLQEILPPTEWLIGFSRKSFLRKKYNLTTEDRLLLDQKHQAELDRLSPKWMNTVWVRAHAFSV